jgi:hypothetical protein
VANPEDYMWSSYKYYVNFDHRPDWLSTTNTLQFFGEENQQQKYITFIKNIDLENDFKEKIRKKAILGSDSFIKITGKQWVSQEHQTTEIPMIVSAKNLETFPLAQYQKPTIKFKQN